MRILLILAILALSSCGDDQYRVKIKNGAIIKAFDPDKRKYTKGDTVCIYLSLNSVYDVWEINPNGKMQDTVICSFNPRTNNNSCIDYKIGIIK